MSTDLCKYTLEACVDSVESALAAKAGGATRLELCADLIVGGTTPSLSLLRAAKRETGLPVHALLRPRFGDFLYTEREFALMLEDGQALLKAGADALVSGCLTPQGDLDEGRLEKLVSLAHSHGKRFTLHRAFDVCKDPFAGLELCKRLGVDIILTSGQGASCLDGLPLLEKLWKLSGPVELLIGAGVNADAIRRVKKVLPQAVSFHMSGKQVLNSGMAYRKEGINMGLPGFSEFQIWRTDENAVRAAREVLEEKEPEEVPDWYRPFGGLPEELRERYVLCPRVFDEELSDCREVFRQALTPRLKGLSLEEAILEVNRWCAEHVTYRSTDDYTDSALRVYNRGYGRCGEESVFTVNALRSVGIAARQVYAPWWSHCDDNHAWVEAWDGKNWRYLGACEPEPVLDRGWFTSAASRAMLVHAHYFLPGEETPRQELVTGRYAQGRTAKLTVTVLDEGGKPVPGAAVRFQVLNMSDFLTIAVRQTGEDGKAFCEMGFGSILAAAGRNGAYGEALIEVTPESAAVEHIIKLGEKADSDFPKDLAFAAPAEEYAARPVPLTTAQKQSRREVLDRCAQLREKWAASCGDRPSVGERDGTARAFSGRESFVSTGSCTLTLGAPQTQAVLWRQNYSLSRLEGEAYQVVRLADIPAGEEKSFSLPEGRYRLMTTLRLPSGDQLARRWDLTLEKGEGKSVALFFPKAAVEELFCNFSLPAFSLTDRAGKERESEELFGESPFTVLLWLEPGREPTEHILNELREAGRGLSAGNCSVSMVLEDFSKAEDFTLKRTLRELPQAKLWQGDFADTAPALARAVFEDPEKLPLALLVDRKGKCLYASSGYNVGTVELLIQLLRVSDKN